MVLGPNYPRTYRLLMQPLQVALVVMNLLRKNRSLPITTKTLSNPKLNRDGIGEVAEVARKIKGVTKIRTLVMPSQTQLAIHKTRVTIKAKRFKGERKTQINDYNRLPVGGRLVRFRKSWTRSFHYRIVAQGLKWSWKENKPPHQQISNWFQETSPDMDKDLYKLYRKKVIEKVRFNKFTSRLF